MATRLRIKELAEAREWGPTKLQNEANRLTPDVELGYATVLSLWNNKTKSPSLAALESIAKALGTTIGALFDEGAE